MTKDQLIKFYEYLLIGKIRQRDAETVVTKKVNLQMHIDVIEDTLKYLKDNHDGL